MASPAIDAGLALEPLLLAAAAMVSALVTAAAIGYAKRRRLVDLPGQRRLHDEPTPRGGGIGIVVALASCGFGPLLAVAPPMWLALTATLAALVAVAAIGWIDDHHPLATWPRFAVHLVAAGLAGWMVDPGMPILVFVPVALALAWSINLHNFMDGANGLLAMQASFVLAVLTFALQSVLQPEAAHLAAVGAVATLAFVPFNLPRARVFMGDVGSGALGLLVGVASVWAWRAGALDLPQILVLSSAFVIDATATLVSRFLRGLRWYAAHREHLYQWLARRGSTHARVTAAYLGWNLVVVLPALIAPRFAPVGARSVYSWAVAGGVYALGLAIWIVLKHRLARRP